MLASTFPAVDNSAIPLQFVHTVLSPFFGRGTRVLSLQSVGIFSDSHAWLQSACRLLTAALPPCSPSSPADFPFLKWRLLCALHWLILYWYTIRAYIKLSCVIMLKKLFSLKKWRDGGDISPTENSEHQFTAESLCYIPQRHLHDKSFWILWETCKTTVCVTNTYQHINIDISIIIIIINKMPPGSSVAIFL